MKTNYKKLLAVLLALSLAVLSAGCAAIEDELLDVLPFANAAGAADEEQEESAESGEASAQATSKMRETNTISRAEETQIGAAIAEIYAENEVSGIVVCDDEKLKEVFLIDPEDVLEYKILYTDGKYGVADICIVKPAEDKRDAIVEAIRQRLDSRIAFFENYDVNGSLQITKNAEVFTQGGYIIMLAFEDNEAKRAVIDKYIAY